MVPVPPLPGSGGHTTCIGSVSRARWRYHVRRLTPSDSQGRRCSWLPLWCFAARPLSLPEPGTVVLAQRIPRGTPRDPVRCRFSPVGGPKARAVLATAGAGDLWPDSMSEKVSLEVRISLQAGNLGVQFGLPVGHAGSSGCGLRKLRGIVQCFAKHQVSCWARVASHGRSSGAEPPITTIGKVMAHQGTGGRSGSSGAALWMTNFGQASSLTASERTAVTLASGVSYGDRIRKTSASPSCAARRTTSRG